MSDSTTASTSAREFSPTLALHRSLPKATRARARYATMAVFFIAGMMYASWACTCQPYATSSHSAPACSRSRCLRSRAARSSQCTTGSWIARAGTRTACMAGGIAMMICGSLILVTPWFWLLLVVLAAFGFGMATLDVAMNAEASAVEQALAQPIMSSLHGMFSIGGMAGAAASGALLAHGLAPAAHLALAAGVSLLVLLASMPSVLPHVPHHDEHAKASSSNRWRSGALWALGGLALVALIAEGAMYDWATVYIRDVVEASPSVSSAAYAAFSGGMAAGRFGGDAVRARFGAPQLIFGSVGLAFIGMVMALVLPNAIITMTGFTLMGRGLANMMPVLFAAARIEGVTAAEGLAQVAGLAYFGLLLGLCVVATCCAAITLIGPKILKRLKI